MGTKKAPVSIVPIEEVMTPRQILDENWRLISLAPMLLTVDETLKWLARRRLLCNEVKCAVCGILMKLNRGGNSSDGFIWTCRSCRGKKSVRDGSFFSRSHLSLQQIVVFIYCWSVGMQQQQIAKEVNIGIGHTLIDWCKFCRQECDVWLRKQPSQIGGVDDNNQPTIVEIATKHFHSKYPRGINRNGHWVFCGIERESGRCFLVEVPDQTTDTLLPLLRQLILPGSHIVSDRRSSFEGIETLNGGVYLHSVVTHKEHSMDHDDDAVHTEHIEKLWMRAKRRLKNQLCIAYDLFPSYLREFEFRNHFKGDMFSSFLFILAENHNL